jgi:hypothetical protein
MSGKIATQLAIFFDVSGTSHIERYCDTFVKSVVCLDDEDSNNNTVSVTLHF